MLESQLTMNASLNKGLGATFGSGRRFPDFRAPVIIFTALHAIFIHEAGLSNFLLR